MKWLLTLLAGVLLGAGGLFVALRQMAQQAPDSAVAASTAPAPAGSTGTSVTPARSATSATSDSAVLITERALPAAPVVPTDLPDADLPLRPSRQVTAAMNDVTAGLAVTAPGTADKPLLIPVEGVKLTALVDNFNQSRGKQRHHGGLDIMAPKGSKVVAAADGKVVKLFNSPSGGLTVYQFDPSEKYAYYYAHLARYANGLKEGSVLRRGDPVGDVGSTGNADPNAPHLHFAVIELTPARQWWAGIPLNPYPLLGESGAGGR